MGKFTIKKQTNDEYMFNLKAENGEIILTSEGYTAKSSCKNGIDSVKANAPEHMRYEQKIAVNGKYYFVLKAKNGEPIGRSQLYASQQGMENGIQSVKNNAPDAEVIDETISIS